jgi:hypothetical protein
MSLGQRQVVDLAAEVGMHLLEPYFLQTLASSVSSGSNRIVTLNAASPQPATSFLYPGALVVIGWHGTTAEVVTAIQVTGDDTFTATLAGAHSAGEQVFSATFPTQQPTDPIFTQSEIISYIAQAQNEFLTKVPLIFELFSDLPLLLGQTYQTLPATTIELERVAVQSNPASTTFAISSIARSSGTVTAVLASSVNTDSWTPSLPIQVSDVTDSSYNSTNNSTFLLATVSADGLTLTWLQAGADSTSSGGQVSRPILTRLYESSQEQLSLNQPWWQSQGGTPPTQWFEDRTGVYGWGVAPPPQGNYWVELLTSVRAGETLTLLDYFLVPDAAAYAIKWRVLAYAWSKTGVQRSPLMEKFAKGKFDFYCLLWDRFLRNSIMKTGAAGAAAGGNF